MATRRYSLDETVFRDASQSERSAYFVGLLMADGNVHEAKGTMVISLKLSGDDDCMVSEFRDFLGSNQPLQYVPAGEQSFMGSAKKYHIQERTYLSVASKQIAADLERYGVIPRKSLVARVNLLENNRHFWRGLIDGNGSLSIRTHARCTLPVISLVGSQSIVNQFLTYVRTLVETDCNLLPAKSVWRLCLQSQAAAVVVRELYGDCTIALPRKKAAADEIMARDWTPINQSWDHLTKEAVLDLYQQHGENWKAVADHLGMNVGHLKYTRRRLGIFQSCLHKPKANRKLGWITAEMLLSLYEKHGAWTKVGDELGIPSGTVNYLRKRLGIWKSDG